jgi:hypothetical protein
MKEKHEAYEELADRAVRLLAAVAKATSKTDPEKLKGMEGNVARLIQCVFDHTSSYGCLTQPSSTLHDIKLATEARLLTPTSMGKLGAMKKLIRYKGKDAVCASADQEQTKHLGAQLDRAVEEMNVRKFGSYSRPPVLIPFARLSLRSA